MDWKLLKHSDASVTQEGKNALLHVLVTFFNEYINSTKSELFYVELRKKSDLSRDLYLPIFISSIKKLKDDCGSKTYNSFA